MGATTDKLECTLRSLGETNVSLWTTLRDPGVVIYGIQQSVYIDFDLAQLSQAKQPTECVRWHLIMMYDKMARLAAERAEELRSAQ